ncbi:MAG: hypothetical protein M3400_15680 [Actinomycetota bacterium]|nr:hypothetical protein [Actinomycetota bacterium]
MLSVLVLLGALLGIFIQATTILFIIINVLIAVTAIGVIYYLARPDSAPRLSSSSPRQSALPSATCSQVEFRTCRR